MFTEDMDFMDRRQRKSREAILHAFTKLLSKKNFSHITVSEIIDEADVGRATFYSHFETKDFLLKELCRELFCHIFDEEHGECEHRHIFTCDAPNDVFLHLAGHIEKNDNHILDLLSSENNELFLSYFKEELKALVKSQGELLSTDKSDKLPQDFLLNHICATFVETIRWWVDNKMKLSVDEITKYFYIAIK